MSHSEIEDKTKLLMVHGQPGTGNDFNQLQQWLPSWMDWRAPDRPGWGNSSLEPTDLIGNRDWLLAEMGNDTDVLIGYSFGAAVATLAARERKVSLLVLVAPAVVPSAIVKVDRLLGLRYLGHIASYSASIMAGRLGRSSTGSKAHSFFTEQRHLVKQLYLSEEALRCLTTPVLVVAGGRDKIVPPIALLDTISCNGGSEIEIIKRAGHGLIKSHGSSVALAISKAVRKYCAKADG
jgi:pimeloyl-ACP methyl ester carboxylesterase